MPARPKRPAARDAGTPVRRSRAHSLFAVGLVLAACWAYSTSFHGVFVGDDLEAIVQNPNITSLSTGFTTPADTTVAGRPIVSLTFAIN